MSLQVCEQQWALLYFRKKSQFNEFSEFKSKSFQYQKSLGKLHFLASQDEEKNKNQIKKYIKALDGHLEQIKNILSEMHEQMKFLKLQSFASLIESFEQLIRSMHHYYVKDKREKIQYRRDPHESQNDNINQNCQKCLCSINTMNVKKIYDQITTTQAFHDEQNSKMTRQQRRKMISQLDEYDILIAQKDNYLRKVNAVLQNKGKVCELSNIDKTYNFLSDYLSTIQKLHQKRAKSYKQDPNAFDHEQNENKWQQESYKHILEYIKRVIFEHFVNECSGPVKKMFEKINIDNIFKSFKDQTNGSDSQDKFATMKNHETQTIMTNEGEQLKMVERRLEFRMKQITTLKINKDELEKKYITSLEMNRKIQAQVYDLKKQKKHLQSQIKTAQQNLTLLKQNYQEKLEQFEQEQRRTFEDHVNQRQKIMRISKQIEADFRNLDSQHKKCDPSKRKQSPTEAAISVETQIYQHQMGNENFNQIDAMSKTAPYAFKKRRSLFKNSTLTSFKGERRSYSKQPSKGILNDSKQNDFIVDQNQDQQIDQNNQYQEYNLQFQSKVTSLQVCLTDEEKSKLLKAQNEKQDKTQQKKTYKLNKYSKNKFLKTQQSLNTTDLDEDQPTLDKSKRIKLSMNSFRKMNKQKPNQNPDEPSKNYKFSKFNRYTENDGDLSNDNKKFNIAQQKNESDIQERKDKSVSKERRIYQVSERLYKKKQKQNEDVPFERVIEKGKEKFYIKKISRQSINYKTEKQKIRQISQILKPYVYNNNSNVIAIKRQQSRTNLKSIRQRLSQLSFSNKRFSLDRRSNDFREQNHNVNGSNNSFTKENRNSRDSNHSFKSKKVIGKDIITVQHIIESEFAYLKAVGFIDFIMKIGNQNKKVVKAMGKIQNQVRNRFKTPSVEDLQLFGGPQEAQNYIRGKQFWSIENMKENIMIYTKNDNLSIKVQKYFNLLRRANPELFGTLIQFLTNPIFAVFGREANTCQQVAIVSQDNCFIKDLFNQLQKYHKIKHNECTHIADFLQKIGFYRYTYF